MLVDSHTHIYLEHFNDDFEEMIQSAEDQGIGHFLLPNIDVESMDAVLDCTRRLPGKAHPMVGLHPCSVKDDFKEQLAALKAVYQKQPAAFCAIGEIGIDLYWDQSTLDWQVEAFEYQINWAKEAGLPIVIHVRNAFDEVFEVVERMNDDRLQGVFHCFTGTLEQAQKILGYGGFMLGIGGVLTFKNGKIDQFIDQIPLERIVLETDAPYLAPKPHRGKRNEPAYISLVAARLAALHEVELEVIASQTTANCREMFKLALPNHEATP